MRVASTTTCDDDATTMKQWAPLSPADELDVADFKWTPALMLGLGGARGERGGGQNGNVFLCRLIVEVGSQVFF